MDSGVWRDGTAAVSLGGSLLSEAVGPTGSVVESAGDPTTSAVFVSLGESVDLCVLSVLSEEPEVSDDVINVLTSPSAES